MAGPNLFDFCFSENGLLAYKARAEGPTLVPRASGAEVRWHVSSWLRDDATAAWKDGAKIGETSIVQHLGEVQPETWKGQGGWFAKKAGTCLLFFSVGLICLHSLWWLSAPQI